MWICIARAPASSHTQFKTQEAEAFLVSIHCTTFGLIKCETQFVQHLLYYGKWTVCSSFTEDDKVSRPRELPPQALAELYVNVSAHTAPIIQPVTQDPASSEQISLVLA